MVLARTVHSLLLRTVPVLLLALSLRSARAQVVFRDVSRRANIWHGRKRLKYGGPAVADLDGDGWPDLIFGHHDQKFVDVYLNRRNGSFYRVKWNLWSDTHGFTPFRLSPRDRRMHFALSSGGAYGTKLTHPTIWRMTARRRVEAVTDSVGNLRRALGRGRNSVFVNLHHGNETDGPDAIFTNAVEPEKWNRNVNRYAFENRRGKLVMRTFLRAAVRYDINWYSTVADVDQDGQMELLSMHDLKVFKLTGDFILKDITADVLPAGKQFAGTVAISEFDYDNDGRFDLYIARSRRGDLSWLRNRYEPFRDYLLRNVGNGRYVDVSWQAKLPRELLQNLGRSEQRARRSSSSPEAMGDGVGDIWRVGSAGESRGVTTGDFNNDGWMDIVISRWSSQDVLLLNNQDGTFRQVGPGNVYGREDGIPGDMVTAVDYDRDGRLDLIVSEGHTHNVSHGGFYRILRNVSERHRHRHYLLVRVGASPRSTATSLHAVVSVYAAGVGKRMVRRVGSPGTAVSQSYIELVHFGVGWRTSVAEVSVRWTDGTTESKYDVASDRLVTFGWV